MSAVKILIKYFHDSSHVPYAELWVIIGFIPDITDALFYCCWIFLYGDSVHQHTSLRQFIQPRDQIDTGGLPRAILPDIPHNIPFGQRKADILQRKIIKMFTHMVYFNRIHTINVPPHIL